MAQGIALSGDGRTIDPRTVVKNSGSPNYLYWILGSLLASGDADDDSSAILRLMRSVRGILLRDYRKQRRLWRRRAGPLRFDSAVLRLSRRPL